MRRFGVATAVVGVLMAVLVPASVTASAAPAAGPDPSSRPVRVTFDASRLAEEIPGGGTMYVSWLVPYPGHPELSDSTAVMAVLLERLFNSGVDPVPDGKRVTQVWDIDRARDNYAAATVCVEPTGGARSCTPFVFHVGPRGPGVASWHVRTPWCADTWAPLSKAKSPGVVPSVALTPEVGVAVMVKSAAELRVTPVGGTSTLEGVPACPS